MRDIPGFGVWLAIMTVMSGSVAIGCGPDKPAVGGGGGKPSAPDAAIGAGDAGSTTRPPPVQPADSGAERPPPATTTGAATGCTPTTDAAPAMDAATTVSTGGRSGTGGVTGGAGGGAPAPASGGAPSNTGGAIGTGGAAGGAGGARPPASGGAPGSGGARPATGGAGTGGATSSGGVIASGGATNSGGVGGIAGAGGAATGGVAPAPGELAIVELLINPASTDTGREWIELVNRTPHALFLSGLHIADAANDAAVDFGGSTALLPGGARAVLVQSADATKNGGITATTAAVVGVFGTLVSLNNDADTISISAGGVVIDEITWDASLGTGYDGHALVLDDAGKRCPATAAFGDAGSFGTPGTAGTACP